MTSLSRIDPENLLTGKGTHYEKIINFHDIYTSISGYK